MNAEIDKGVYAALLDFNLFDGYDMMLSLAALLLCSKGFARRQVESARP